MVRLLR